MLNYQSSEKILGNMDLNVIFMGTPAFAIPSLEGLINSNYSIAGVYTNPDKPVGRGQSLSISAVKKAALAHNLPVFQPLSLKLREEVDKLNSLGPDLVVVAAYGQIVPKEVLNIPKYGCVNVHPSLLPKHRGATPIPTSIVTGDNQTGVTIMLMDEGIDTGLILAQVEETVLPVDTTATLTQRLARLGAVLLLDTISRWIRGEIKPAAQDESRATYSKAIRKEDGQINWHLNAEHIEKQIRAFQPWPGTYTFWKGKRLEIKNAASVEDEGNNDVGRIRLVKKNGEKAIGITTNKGLLILHSVRLEGKKEMTAEEFARGQKDFVGAVLPLY